MSETEPVEKFLVVGIITATEFQKARFITEKLYASFPKLYEKPNIRAMLDVDWDEYLTKMKRRHKPMWALEKNVAIFLNNTFLGDDETLIHYVTKKFHFNIHMDWYEIGKCQLVEYLKNIMGKLRQLAYMTISINNKVIGTMLFELYNDLVPLTCENFLNKCRAEEGGYSKTPIHRIVKNSWVQCGGWNLEEKKIPCENYIVPHNRRGVLNMCNVRRHKKNSTQFFINLAPAPWMDYKYVAFGQLLHGNEILKKIEKVPTYFESPKFKIKIVKCGEFTFDTTPEYYTSEEYRTFQNQCLNSLMTTKIPSVTSDFFMRKYRGGDYCLKTDLRNYYWPFMTPINYLTAHYNAEDGHYTYEKPPSITFNRFLPQDFLCLPQDPSFDDITI